MKDGRFYTASSAVVAENVVKDKRFNIAVIGLVHGHVNGIINGLCEAGAKITCLYDSEPERIRDFTARYGSCIILNSAEEVLARDDVDLVVNCIMPDIRAEFSVKCIKAGKAVFSDKPGFLTLEEGRKIQDAVHSLNGRYCIYFSEHFHNEGCILANNLIKQNRIGKVFNYIGMGPHRLNAPTRASWFFNPEINGDVIVDLGCHLSEQFLLFTGNNDASVVYSHRANINHCQYPDFYDCGEFILVGANGATGHIKVDWFTSDGIPAWGDCRAFVFGTDGEIEVRKYCDLAVSDDSDNVYIADQKTTEVIHAHNKVGFDFFGKLILDCMNKNKESLFYVNGVSLSDFCIKAMELSVQASLKAQ